MFRTFWIAAAMLGYILASSAAPALARTEAEIAALRDKIWQLELDIYARRQEGDMQLYVDHTSPNYMVWPPQYDAPFNAKRLDESRAGVQGIGGEKLAMSLAGFTVEGDTALIYYQTHRTARAGGAPVDEWFETIHVWADFDGTWKLVGGMARPRPDNRRALGNQ